MAAACGCHSLFLGDMLRRFHVCFVSGTMCRRLCDCRMEGREWKEVRERSGQESRWVSRRRGIARPAQHRSCRAPSLTLCSIVFDASSTQRGSGCRHRHECDRKGTHLLLRFEESHRVAQRRAHNPSRTPRTTPGSGRGVFASWKTLRWSPSSLQVDGRLSFLPFPMRGFFLV
ncbi:hypothetical protein BCY84_00784 [Trypanosoma cruzi cruzi]|nr:hypothetical protein BCY84_00784 [Trypanosoma cruzi cruzi]